MGRVYDVRFKIGAALWVANCIAANAGSYVRASEKQADLEASLIGLSGTRYVSWGVPFWWDASFGSMGNLSVLLFGALFFGLLFRWMMQRFGFRVRSGG